MDHTLNGYGLCNFVNKYSNEMLIIISHEYFCVRNDSSKVPHEYSLSRGLFCVYFFGMGGLPPTPLPHLHYSESDSSPDNTQEAFCSHWRAVVSELFKEILASLVSGRQRKSHDLESLVASWRWLFCFSSGEKGNNIWISCHAARAIRRTARPRQEGQQMAGAAGRAKRCAPAPSTRRALRQHSRSSRICSRPFTKTNYPWLFRWCSRNHRRGRVIYLCHALATQHCIGGWRNACQKSSKYELSFLSLDKK